MVWGSSLDWTGLSKLQWRAFVNTVINICVPKSEKNILTGLATLSFSKLIVLHRVWGRKLRTIQPIFVRFQVLTSISIKMNTALWDLMACSPVEINVSEARTAFTIRAIVLMLEAIRTSETSVYFYETSRAMSQTVIFNRLAANFKSQLVPWFPQLKTQLHCKGL
jgi:hypothetical protein